MICHWSLSAVGRLYLSQYLYTALRLLVKVVKRVSIEVADQLLGRVLLHCLQSGKRGRASIQEVTAGDWQELAAVLMLALDKTVFEVLQILDLTNNEQIQFRITEPLSIFSQRILAASSAYGCRCLQEQTNFLVNIDNANKLDLSFDAILTTKHARLDQRLVCIA